jgi:cytochrome oxidase Cu insertion factor (SCO1/SenC/PrrC family)
MKTKKPSIIILLLTCIFCLPFILAWLAYAKGLFLPGATVAHGTLLSPPLFIKTLSLKDRQGEVQDSQLRGKWWLLYFTQTPGDALSRRNVYFMRQIRQAAGKDLSRIERALVAPQFSHSMNSWLQKNYPGTYYFTLSSVKMVQLQESLPKRLALEKSWFYLVDPLGNILLFYTAGVTPKGILKDLQRVLRVSQIG